MQTLVVSADSDLSGSFKIQIHFPSIRQPIVGGKDLSLAATHETGDISWNFGSNGPSAASIETALAELVGAVEVFAYAPDETVNSGTTTTEYRWDITFTYLQQIDSGNVDSIEVVDALLGTNVQSNVVEKQRGTSKSYQRVVLTPSGTVSGTFALSFRGETTTHLEFDVSSVGMKSQLFG